MGTSTRKLNRKIKEILKERNNDDIEDVVPEVRSVVFNDKNIEDDFSGSDFGCLIQEGVRGLSSIKDGDFSQDYDLGEEINEEELKEDPISIEKVTTKILEVAEENEQIESELLIKSFKYAMTNMIKQDKDTDEFVEELCYYLIKLLIETEMIEALSAVYQDEPVEKFEKLIEIEARRIVEDELEDDMQKFIQNEMDTEKLIQNIVVKCANAEVGGF